MSSERDPLDRFYTDQRVADYIAEQVSSMVPGARSFLEPSCGKGAFVNAALKAWALEPFRRYASTLGLVPKGAWSIVTVDKDPDTVRYLAEVELAESHVVVDWLQYEPQRRFDVILANPPFAVPVEGLKRGKPVALKHIEKMLDSLEVGGVCAVLIRSGFLGTKKRHALFRDRPPKYIDQLVSRPSFNESRKQDNVEYVVIYWVRESEQSFGIAGETKLRWVQWKQDAKKKTKSGAGAKARRRMGAKGATRTSV